MEPHEAWYNDGFWTGVVAGSLGTVFVLVVPFLIGRLVG